MNLNKNPSFPDNNLFSITAVIFNCQKRSEQTADNTDQYKNAEIPELQKQITEQEDGQHGKNADRDQNGGQSGRD